MSTALIIIATLAAGHSHAQVNPTAAARALIQRTAPALADAFSLEVLPQPNGAMQLDSDGKSIILRGSGAVELASAFNWYLNDYLNVTIDWSTYGDKQLPTSGPLPLPEKSPVVSRRVAWTYYMNVCTYGYSLAFVPWSYWEQHIDWMAMQGINLPLAFLGQEWVWARVFESFNISLAEQQSFYSGAAFLPWFRMGNMQGFGGPLSDSWMTARRDLAIKVFARMRELGMTPALSAFAGHVPAAFATHFPSAKISRSPDWAGFDLADPVTAPYADVWLLDPAEPLFVEVGKRFIELQTATYGTDHIYQADTFNEIAPPTHDPDYLRASSAAVYAAMAAADPSAIWLMQGWLFQSSWWTNRDIQAYLGGVPRGSMWLLDLFGDSNPIWSKTASYYGHPFIFCTLLNFGGQQGIVGNTPRVVTGFEAALANSTVNGVGITMEGIWTNYNMFELQLLLTWEGARFTPGTVAPKYDPVAYHAAYGHRKYGGVAHPSAVAAWALLGSTIYSGNGGGFGSIISGVPSLAGINCPHPPIGEQPPTPEAPPGYERRHPLDGYWDPPPGARLNRSVTECADLCDAAGDQCDAFEVYIHYPPDRGDCYPMLSANKPFVPMGAESRTYLKKKPMQPQAVREADGVVVGAAAAAVSREQRVSQASGAAARDAACALDSASASRRRAEASTFQSVWKLLLEAKDSHGHVPSFRFDVVDVGREVIAANFTAMFAVYNANFVAKNAAATAVLARQLLQTIDDYERLLSTDVHFLLGRWIAWARDWGEDAEAKALLEYGARNQLTLWGPTGQINDYAKKEWSGIVATYYKPRWAKMLNAAQAYLEGGATGSWADASVEYCRDTWATLEKPWQTDYTTTFPTTPTADTIDVALSLMSVYGAQ